MMIEDAQSTTILRFNNLATREDVSHFVSSRLGGFSSAPFDSLNLGFNTADDPRNILRNRQRLAAYVGAPLTSFVTLKQVHGSHVEVVTADMAGRGAADYESALDATDALVTDAEDVYIVVRVADCTPVLFYDPVKRVVGAAHAGWRGTVQLIGQKVIQTMIERFASDPADILAGIGPSIGQCCCQVGPEVISQIQAVFGDGLIERETPDGRGYFDLWGANRRQLMDVGLCDENIEVAGLCTRCRADLFFSERHTPGTGRFAAGIMLLNETCASCTAINCTWCRKQPTSALLDKSA